MTNQLLDTIRFEDQDYEIIKVSGTGELTPQTFGIHPAYLSPESTRDFVAKYEVVEGFLYLQEMRVGKVSGRPKPIKGKLPDEDNVYREIAQWSRFSGSLRLARELIPEAFEAAGVKDETTYKKVINILFQVGELLLVRESPEDTVKNT